MELNSSPNRCKIADITEKPVTFRRAVAQGKIHFMEAMTGVSAALLCAYDLLKPLGPELCLEEIYLLEKEGGKNRGAENDLSYEDDLIITVGSRFLI